MVYKWSSKLSLLTRLYLLHHLSWGALNYTAAIIGAG